MRDSAGFAPDFAPGALGPQGYQQVNRHYAPLGRRGLYFADPSGNLYEIIAP
ncbi:hypothetical protein AB0L25_21810 [Spirillospora sp. NPDC052242]